MIGEKQKQEVAEGSTAIQSGRDTHVRQGLSTEDLRAIVETMADQLPKYAAIASSMVEKRLKSFEEKVIHKFEGELKDHRKAFEDPDFQFLLRSAQTTFSRSGDEQTCDNLVNLIGERSKLERRSRVSLSINAAVERAGVLTRNEFAELSYAFIVKNVRRPGAREYRDLASFLHNFLSPLLPDVSEEDTSYSYLEAIGCATISMGEVSFRQVLTRNYPNLLCRGLQQHQLGAEIGDSDFAQSLVDSGIVEVNTAFMCLPAPLSVDDFKEAVSQAGLDQGKGEAAWSAIERTALSKPEIRAALLPFGFDIESHFRIWNATPLKNLVLTSVGIAIGHSNLKRVTNLPADLSIWIK